MGGREGREGEPRRENREGREGRESCGKAVGEPWESENRERKTGTERQYPEGRVALLLPIAIAFCYHIFDSPGAALPGI